MQLSGNSFRDLIFPCVSSPPLSSWRFVGTSCFVAQLFQKKFLGVFISLVLRRWLYTEHYRFMSILNCVMSQFFCIECSNKLLTCYIIARFWGSISAATFYIMMLPQHWLRGNNCCPCWYGVSDYYCTIFSIHLKMWLIGMSLWIQLNIWVYCFCLWYYCLLLCTYVC